MILLMTDHTLSASGISDHKAEVRDMKTESGSYCSRISSGNIMTCFLTSIASFPFGDRLVLMSSPSSSDKSDPEKLWRFSKSE